MGNASAHPDPDPVHELQRLQSALDEHVIYSIADRSGKILDVSQGFCRISGYERHELIGQDHRLLNSGHHPRSFWVDMWKTIGSGRAWRGDVCNRAKDGSLYWVDSTNIPQLDANGKIDRYTSLRIDITEKKRVAAELDQARAQMEEARERTERAIAGTSDGLWEFIPATNEVWYSAQFKRLLGLEASQFASFEPVLASFTDRLHPDDLERTLAAVEAHLKERVPYDIQYRLRVESGGHRWFRARASSQRHDDGRVLRMSGSLTDVHDQHTTESRLDLATRAARVGLWDWDVPTGKTYFSDTFYTMLGYEPGELPMELETWASLVHPEDLESAKTDIEAHLRGDTERYENAHRLRCKDGSYLWIKDVGETVEWQSDRTPKRMIGVHVEIQELHDALAEAEAASHAKSEFLANMSHEIRTPMTAILGYADMLSEDREMIENPAEATAAAHSIHANANHLLTVINDILDVSKIEAGKLLVERIAMSPAQIVADVDSLVGARARGKGLEFRVEYDGAIPSVIESDPTRLRQILLNLCGNAVKFTEVGGVTISVSCDGESRSLVFAVTDTGIGMSSEQCAAISGCEAFWQADSSTTRKYGGTGLGLRISSSLSALLGGGLSVESELGRGTTFRFTVATGDLAGAKWLDPQSVEETLEDEAPASRKKGSARSERPLDGMRILLAEDGPDNQRLISFHLERAGAEVVICENGRIAVETVEACPAEELPHLVFMDMQMPELDGYAATRQLRANGFTRPIVSLTAHAMQGDRERCIEAGCDEYLTKPIDKQLLIETCVHLVTRELETT